MVGKIGKRKYIRMMVNNGHKDPKELASCYGKVRFNTYEDAKVQSDRKPEIVKPYHCKYCGKYHIGRRQSGNLNTQRTTGIG